MQQTQSHKQAININLSNGRLACILHNTKPKVMKSWYTQHSLNTEVPVLENTLNCFALKTAPQLCSPR